MAKFRTELGQISCTLVSKRNFFLVSIKNTKFSTQARQAGVSIGGHIFVYLVGAFILEVNVNRHIILEAK